VLPPKVECVTHNRQFVKFQEKSKYKLILWSHTGADYYLDFRCGYVTATGKYELIGIVKRDACLLESFVFYAISTEGLK
jgi:hypothetical protein